MIPVKGLTITGRPLGASSGAEGPPVMAKVLAAAGVWVVPTGPDAEAMFAASQALPGIFANSSYSAYSAAPATAALPPFRCLRRRPFKFAATFLLRPRYLSGKPLLSVSLLKSLVLRLGLLILLLRAM